MGGRHFEALSLSLKDKASTFAGGDVVTITWRLRFFSTLLESRAALPDAGARHRVGEPTIRRRRHVGRPPVGNP